MITINHQLVKNPSVEEIKHNFLVRVVFKKQTEYFILTEIDKVGSDSEEYHYYQGYSLAYQLDEKIIRKHEIVSKNMSEILNEILGLTNWEKGYIDAEFDLKYRSIDITSMTILEIINELTEKFGALVVWDTVDKKINMYNPDSIGQNKGFKITDYNYLVSLSENQNANEVITRLNLYGHDGLSIREINPTGSSYIEDYSYYMYPFERDSEKNIVQHSHYMSDELCHAILDYQELVSSKESEFKSYINLLDGFNRSKVDREKELQILKTELGIILDHLDTENSRGVPDKNLHTQLVSDRAVKEQEVRDKNNEISEIQDQIDDTMNKINTLQDNLKVENNFSYELLEEWGNYIKEGEFENDSIIHEEDLLEEGLKEFEKLREPLIEVDIDIINLFEIIECQHDWDKLELGDIITVRYQQLGTDIKARIREINYDFENSSIKVLLTNADKNVDGDLLGNLMKDISSTSTEVWMNKVDWGLSKENNGMINEIINNIWDATKQAVEAGYEQLIEISDRGIIIRSPEDPDTYLVLQNGMLSITGDRGNTWKHSITSEGIVGERIYGKIIMGVNLAIEDESGIIKFRGSRGQIFDRDGEEVMRLGLVSNYEDNEPDCFGLESWNLITKVSLTDCEGISISRRTTQDEWDKIFWVRSNDGTLFTKDMVAERLKIVNNIGDEILNAETGDFDLGWFERIVADGKLTTTEKYEIWAKIDSIMREYNFLIQHSQTFKFAGRDDRYNFNSQNPESTRAPSNNIQVDTSQLTIKYNALINYIGNYISIPPNFDENVMQRTDEINRNTFAVRFKDYYDEANRVRGEINNFLFYSGLQLGTFYNNLIIDPVAGFMAIRDDYKYRARMSATDGLALEKWEGRWVKKLYAAIGDPDYDDGTLIAEGLVTKNLKIVDGELGEKIVFDINDGITIYGNNGEEIRLNANEGIAIDVEDDPRFWIGTDGNLYAKKLVITPENPEGLVELPDGSFISDLTVNSLRSLNSTSPQDYVYIKDNFIKLFTGYGDNENDAEKFSLELKGTGHDGYPYSVWGRGNAQGTNKGYIYKGESEFVMRYDTNYGENQLSMHDTSVDALRLVTEQSNISLEAGVRLKLNAGERIVANAVNNIDITSNSRIRFVVGGSYIEITSSGVKINGSRIDLN